MAGVPLTTTTTKRRPRRRRAADAQRGYPWLSSVALVLLAVIIALAMIIPAARTPLLLTLDARRPCSASRV